MDYPSPPREDSARLTDGQYRALVAYLSYWTPLYPDMGVDAAMSDIGITTSRDDTISELARAGHYWDDETASLTSTV